MMDVKATGNLESNTEFRFATRQLKHPLVHFWRQILYREAVASQSPGLPLWATLGWRFEVDDSTATRLRSGAQISSAWDI
jgi:hypothetical protein